MKDTSLGLSQKTRTRAARMLGTDRPRWSPPGRRARKPPSGRKPKTYLPRGNFFGAGVPVTALTKSEARAELKRRLGVKRLPPGTVLADED